MFPREYIVTEECYFVLCNLFCGELCPQFQIFELNLGLNWLLYLMKLQTLVYNCVAFKFPIQNLHLWVLKCLTYYL